MLVIVLLVLADRQGWLLDDGGDLKVYDGQGFVVTHVVDGDTLDVGQPDRRAEQPRATTRVRLWGIDTPELARPSEGRPADPYADDARRFAQVKAEGQRVTLRLQPHRTRDNYGRLLAYVELPDGTTLNELLVVEGLARADGRWSHRDDQRYELLERQARNDRRGLWAKPGRTEAESDELPEAVTR